jgi:hypothetical protein
MLPTRKTRGFTLIATLMLMLMSGIAIGLFTIWGGQTLNDKGSMASLYYFTYFTGKDKNDGNTTYDPPGSKLHLRSSLHAATNLPPGTPLFRDIDNLSYRQSFTPHTGCY